MIVQLLSIFRSEAGEVTRQAFLAAQALGLVGCAISCGSYFSRRRTLYLLLQMMTVALYGVQYALLASVSGVVNDCVCFAKYLFVFLFLIRGREAPRWVGFVFAGVSVVLGAVAFRTPSDLVPIVTAVLFTYAVWQKNPYVLRICAIVCNGLWIWFNLRAAAYVATGYCCVELLMTVVTIIRLLRTRSATRTTASAPAPEPSVEVVPESSAEVAPGPGSAAAPVSAWNASAPASGADMTATDSDAAVSEQPVKK